MTAIVKPCELPCEKCGHGDIHRTFRASGSQWRIEEYGRARNKYASASAFLATAYRDHIDNHCRCCKYEWQTLPMRKPKKPRPTTEAKERT